MGVWKDSKAWSISCKYQSLFKKKMIKKNVKRIFFIVCQVTIRINPIFKWNIFPFPTSSSNKQKYQCWFCVWTILETWDKTKIVQLSNVKTILLAWLHNSQIQGDIWRVDRCWWWWSGQCQTLCSWSSKTSSRRFLLCGYTQVKLIIDLLLMFKLSSRSSS